MGSFAGSGSLDSSVTTLVGFVLVPVRQLVVGLR